MSESDVVVLYEDNHLLVVSKPPGLPTAGVRPGRPNLVGDAKEYLRRRYEKPGNVYLGVVSRLDAASSGVIVLARTSKSARRLSEAFRTRDVEKTYWAIVETAPDPPDGACVDVLRKDERRQRMVVASAGEHGAQEARLAYRTLRATRDHRAVVEIALETGRKHQIRVQLAHRGWPILGDRKYGSRAPFESGIALHARKIVFDHPVRRTPVEVEAPLPPTWSQTGLS